jgi:hypothetical protein
MDPSGPISMPTGPWADAWNAWMDDAIGTPDPSANMTQMQLRE